MDSKLLQLTTGYKKLLKMTSTRDTLKGGVAVATTIALWASAFPVIRIGVRYFDPIELAALRVATAAVVMLAWIALARPRMPASKDCLRLGICAAVGTASYNCLRNSGQRTVTSGAARLTGNTVTHMTAR